MKSIHIIEDTLPVAWEKSVIECWRVGDNFPTQYDKPDDPNSRDVSALIHVLNPMKEPRIHRAMPGGLDDLEKYRNEVVFGVHDHWVDPQAGKWEYTYHQRLREYQVPGGPMFDQIQKCIDMLRECGFTRRAQAITWQPWEDLGISDPACLQRLWFRVQERPCPTCCGKGEIPHGLCFVCEGTGTKRLLNMNIHIRSNDAYKAGFMNMYAFIELQAYVANELGIEVGEYMHFADSFHIYGSYFDEFKGFLKTVEKRAPEDLVYASAEAYDFFLIGCDTLLSEKDMPLDKREQVAERKREIESLKDAATGKEILD